MKNLLKPVVCALAFTCASVLSAALTIQSELAIPYQGRLAKVYSGEAVTDSVEMSFFLYASEDDAEPVWARSYYVTPNETGDFMLTLSDAAGTALLDDETKTLARAIGKQAIDEPLWLEVSTAATGEPWKRRQPLHALPRAHAAIYADGAPQGLKVTGDLTVYTLSAGTLHAKDSVTATVLTVGDSTTAADETAVTSLDGATVSASLTAPELVCDNAVLLPAGARNNDLFPVGTIILWSGSAEDIPDGWALCDGSPGTHDLRDQFLIGATEDFRRGDYGGQGYTFLSVENLPPHDHDLRYRICEWCVWYENWAGTGEDSWVGQKTANVTTSEALYRTDPENPSASPVKTDDWVHSFAFLPKHYVLCYIQRIK